MHNWLLKCSNCTINRRIFVLKKKITKTAAIHGKEHGMKFVNTDSNSDSYNCEVFLKKTDYNVEVKLSLISSILAYPAFEQTWIYDTESYKKAAKTYNKVIYAIEDLKVDYESEITPGSTLAAMIREAMRPIDPTFKEATRQLPLDESSLIKGEADWRSSLYGNRYPPPIYMNVDKQYNFWGDQTEIPGARHIDQGRKK